MLRKLWKAWQKRFLSFELTGAFLLTGLLIYGTVDCSSVLTRTILYHDWSDIYPVTTVASVALLGFSLTVTSIVHRSSSSPRLALLRQSEYYPTLWDTLFSAIRFLGCLALWSLACLIVDRPPSPNLWMRGILLFFITISILRVTRSIWIIRRIIHIVASPS